MPLTPSTLTPQLRRAGYFITITTIFIQLGEVLLRVWPFRLGFPGWRVTFVAGTSSIAPTLLLMAFVLIAIAVFAGNRPLSLVLSGLAFLAAFWFLLSIGAFTLDSLEIRNQVPVASTRKYDITQLWTLLRVLMGLVGFVMLALASLRSATAMRQQTARQTRSGATVITGNTPTAGPRVGDPAAVKGT